jgi:antitoxin (DNA-binding transcriptional repressor) of toxin-antitoxin stability system
MERIPSSEANKAPGQIFDRVYRGETIMLTRYGRDYVMLCPPPPAEGHKDPKPARR